MSLNLIALFASDTRKAIASKPRFVTIHVPSVPLGDWDWTHWPAMVGVMDLSVRTSTDVPVR